MHLALTLALCLAQDPAVTDDPIEVHAHTNALIGETSPYLLQHAHNPVDWMPWGPEALELAKSTDRPIFLSIGYSACHWCHVMEKESFEDERIAALMNEHFVCIKVDREERPDLDELYMGAVQAMTGSGGWPMSVFLTPALEPFYGGTYFPPTARFGRPGFDDVLTTMNRYWNEERDTLLGQATKLVEHLELAARGEGTATLAPDILERSLADLRERYDPTWGGFGAAPKFPHTADLLLTLRHWKRTGDPADLAMATTTLDRMAEGGIFDQLAGGFSRYSTDEKWLIPHFEKMLYDNGLLAGVYLEAYQATGKAAYARVVRGTLDWTLREMSTPGGGFASSLDADSEGEEGRFYVWDHEDLEAVLGEELGAMAADYFGVTEEGTFEDGKSALWRNEPAADVAKEWGVEVEELERQMESARMRLLAARELRERPGKDDKVLASWNVVRRTTCWSTCARRTDACSRPRAVDAPT
ncbi:MAG: thioredoxin domain-containing protein [Planctomycetota bacterium]|nr:thioredoxin domain-containing protein [Planctomycetota bacterium]